MVHEMPSSSVSYGVYKRYEFGLAVFLLQFGLAVFLLLRIITLLEIRAKTS